MNHPSTSMTTWACGVCVNNEIFPPVPSLTITMFGTVSPPTKLRFDDNGWAAPLGHTVRYDGLAGCGDRHVQGDRGCAGRRSAGMPGDRRRRSSRRRRSATIGRVSSTRAGTIAL